MTQHKNMGVGKIHIPYNWTYADDTEREAETDVTAADVGKLARQLDDNSLWMLTDDSPVTWVQVGGSGGGGSGNTPISNVRFTGGNITMNNSGGFADLSTSLDLTIPAATGDILGINMAAILDAPSGSGNWTAFDAVTRVSGADTNYVSNGTGTPDTLGVPAWFRWEIAETLSGEWLYEVQAGDVDAGNVVLRFKYKTGSAANRVFRASSGQAAAVFVKNYGQ